MKTVLHQRTTSTVLLVMVLSLVTICGQAQETGKRRLLEHAAPPYPELARKIAFEGVVKIDAVVSAEGAVKSVEVKGGSPIFTQAAVDAVRHWKWEAASHETHEIVEVKFTPQ